MTLPLNFDRSKNMKFTHENPSANHRRLNVQDFRAQHSNTISIKNRFDEIDFNIKTPYKKNDNAVVISNISNSVQSMKQSLKKIYEVVRGLFGLDKMPVKRAEEILDHQIFRKDETPEQRLMTIAGAKKILARRDAQKSAENDYLNYIKPKSAKKSLDDMTLKEIKEMKKVNRASQDRRNL